MRWQRGDGFRWSLGWGRGVGVVTGEVEANERWRGEVFAGFATTVGCVVGFFATQPPPTEAILVDVFVGGEEAMQRGGSGGGGRATMDVGSGDPQRTIASARSAGAEVDFPAWSCAICFVEAAEVFGKGTAKEVAKVAQAVQCVEWMACVAVACGSLGSAGIDARGIPIDAAGAREALLLVPGDVCRWATQPYLRIVERGEEALQPVGGDDRAAFERDEVGSGGAGKHAVERVGCAA